MTSTEPIKLRLLKTNGREVICDQDGRELDGVVDFTYGQGAAFSVPTLEVKLLVDPSLSAWDGTLGPEMCDGPEADEVHPIDVPTPDES